MIPRSVVHYAPTKSFRQDSFSGPLIPNGTGLATRYYDGLGQIVSDNVKRSRPTPPYPRRYNKVHGFKTYRKLAPKAFRFVKDQKTYCLGRIEYAISPNPDAYPRYTIEGGNFPGNYPVVTQVETLRNAVEKRVYTKLYEKLRRSELDLAISIAEGSKTVLMIARRSSLLRNLKSFLKAVWKRARGRSIYKHQSIAKSFAEAWLEFTYGWKQLANDIFNLATFSSNIGRTSVIKVRAGLDEDSKSVHTDSQSNVKIHQMETLSCRAEMKIKLSIIASPSVDLSRLASLNPIAIAWELLPFSFVFDWLINISQYLSELQTAVTFNSYVDGGYLTFVTKNSRRTIIPPQKVNGNSLAYTLTSQMLGNEVWTRLSREVVTNIPRPSLPTLKSPVSLEHALTTLSLITGVLKASHLGRKAVYM